MYLGTLGRQPIVSVMEDLIDGTTEKWNKTYDQIERCIDKLLELQQQRLELERQHLALKRELAGLPSTSTGKRAKKGW